MSWRSAKKTIFWRGHLFVRDLEMQFRRITHPVTFAVGMEPCFCVPSRLDHNARVHRQFCVARATGSDKGRAIRYWNSLSVYAGGNDNDNVAWRASLVLLVYSCPSGT